MVSNPAGILVVACNDATYRGNTCSLRMASALRISSSRLCVCVLCSDVWVAKVRRAVCVCVLGISKPRAPCPVDANSLRRLLGFKTFGRRPAHNASTNLAAAPHRRSHCVWAWGQTGRACNMGDKSSLEGFLVSDAYAKQTPSPFDIWHIVFENRWLLGGILAVLSALLESVGLVLQKKAQYKLMGDNLHPNDPKPPRKQVIGTFLFWLGLCMYLAYSPINMLALKYAPETTVLPLNAIVIILNALLSFIVLYERFTRQDVAASLVCMAGALVMNTAMSQTIPGHLEDFPVEEVLRLSNDLLVNEGFAAYIIAWVALLAMCLYIMKFVSMQSVAKPFAVPLLVGLLRTLFHFMSKILVTLVARSTHVKVRNDPIMGKAGTFTTLLFILTVLAISEGVQQLPCRFFVPAMFVSCQVLTATQDLLFFRAWEAMTEKAACWPP